MVRILAESSKYYLSKSLKVSRLNVCILVTSYNSRGSPWSHLLSLKDSSQTHFNAKLRPLLKKVQQIHGQIAYYNQKVIYRSSSFGVWCNLANSSAQGVCHRRERMALVTVPTLNINVHYKYYL